MPGPCNSHNTISASKPYHISFRGLFKADYRAGKPTREAILLGYIRKGRKLEAVQRLALSISKCWSDITGMSENEIELAIAEYPAEVTFRYGARLPEPACV